MTLHIGCHLSVSNGYRKMGEEALSLGADTFQFFTRNPRGGSAKAIDPADAAALNTLMKDNAFSAPIAHAPYTINPCAADEKTLSFARRTMADDLKRLTNFPGAMYNFHPGSHTGRGVDTGIKITCETLELVLKSAPDNPILIETMSGSGSEIGSTFEQIGTIISNLGGDKRLGVCMDTCHVFSGGYDIVNDLDGVFEAFDKAIGLDRLKAFHLNDSLTPFGAHKDRHAKIGEGEIGLDALIGFVNHPAVRGKSICLETPNDADGYAREIALMRANYR